MREINLLHGSDQEPSRMPQMKMPAVPGRGILWFFLVIFAIEMIVLGIVFSLRSNIEKETAETELQIASIVSEVQEKKEDLNLAVSAQFTLQSFSELLKNHNRWSKVMAELGRVTLKVSRYNAVQAEASESEFVIGGLVATYADLGKVILGLETSGEFEKIELVSTSVNEQSQEVEFEILVDAKSTLLANGEQQNADISAPQTQSEFLE